MFPTVDKENVDMNNVLYIEDPTFHEWYSDYFNYICKDQNLLIQLNWQRFAWGEYKLSYTDFIRLVKSPRGIGFFIKYFSSNDAHTFLYFSKSGWTAEKRHTLTF